MAQPFLHTSQDALVVAGFHIDHAIGHQARLRERRGEEIGPGDAPEHLALGAHSDPGCEQRGGRAVYGAVASARDLMKRASRQPSARESRIHLGDPEGKHRFCTPISAFDLRDLCAQ